MKFLPGARTLHHIHGGYEEFLVLDGTLTDNDGYVYNKGDFATLTPGSSHYSYSETGCKVLVFMRGINTSFGKTGSQCYRNVALGCQ